MGQSSTIGTVTLAGAGPGDPDLLTVKTLRRIRAAQVIVHDALVPEAILALAPPGCTRIDAGKRSGDPCSARQEAIQELLADLALGGTDVLRLKGGDPFVFGRGGEEAEFLAARGIPVEIIPGISSFAGAAASIGVPLTQRGLSASFTVLNGHGPDLHRIDWAALVRLGGTWVFLMSRDSLADIARALVEHGADPAFPLALVSNATLPRQAVRVATLSEAAAGGVIAAGKGPALVLAGPTVHAETQVPSGFFLSGRHERILSGLSEAER